MSDPAITVENLGKRFQIGTLEKGADTLREAMIHLAKAPFRRLRNLGESTVSKGEFWAIRNLSFEVQRGDVLGIIGRNGAGKSTLLKLLSRISDPTEGRATIRGRVASLLEVGTGFHNELTGRENIYLNGAILGMRKAEIDGKFDEIVEFSGVSEFLDTPIKRYSSGMKVRLAFAVAAHLEPEILIIDEVLAVGDFDFQNKCIGKMQDVAQSGRTVIFVSHNIAAVHSLCNRAILLERGRLKSHGMTDEILSQYMKEASPAETYKKETGYIRSVRIVDDNGEMTSSLPVGRNVTVAVDVFPYTLREDLVVSIALTNSLGQRVITCMTRQQLSQSIRLDRELTLNCKIHDLRLVPGQYSLSIFAWSANDLIDELDMCMQMEVAPYDLYGTGLLPKARNAVYLPHTTWQIQARSDQ